MKFMDENEKNCEKMFLVGQRLVNLSFAPFAVNYIFQHAALFSSYWGGGERKKDQLHTTISR